MEEPTQRVQQGQQLQGYWIPGRRLGTRIEEEYILGDVIGRGASSTVYKCLRKGRTEWACKVFKKSHLDEKLVQSEINILLHLKHPNIVQLKEVFETPEQIQLILELVHGGELFERIVERGQYTEQTAAQAVRHILNALHYLHQHDIVHRDIKPENLLYESEDDESNLKLADFGLSKLVKEDAAMHTVCGTVGYCAPEILLHKPYDSSIDLWSLGVVTYIMLSGFEPFWDDGGEVAVCRRVVQGDYSFPSPWWDDVSDSAKDLINKLLSVDPAQRPTAREALNHPWTRGDATPAFHMPTTVKKLREFNAKRKFRAATQAVMATRRAMQLLSPDRHIGDATSCLDATPECDAVQFRRGVGNTFQDCPLSSTVDMEAKLQALTVEADQQPEDSVENCLLKNLSTHKENYIGLG